MEGATTNDCPRPDSEPENPVGARCTSGARRRDGDTEIAFPVGNPGTGEPFHPPSQPPPCPAWLSPRADSRGRKSFVPPPMHARWRQTSESGMTQQSDDIAYPSS